MQEQFSSHYSFAVMRVGKVDLGFKPLISHLFDV